MRENLINAIREAAQYRTVEEIVDIITKCTHLSQDEAETLVEAILDTVINNDSLTMHKPINEITFALDEIRLVATNDVIDALIKNKNFFHESKIKNKKHVM